MSLPVIYDGGTTLVADPDTGDMVDLAQASDRAIAHAAQKLAEHDKTIYALKRSLAAELRQRHGVGKATVGGYDLTVAESESWPVRAVLAVLGELEDAGVISPGDVLRCVPEKPKPSGQQIKSLIGRLQRTNPAAAQKLADACTISPPSVRDIHEASVDAEVAA